jgi:hypothetical protein
MAAQEPKHLMIDWETLGTAEDSIVLSVGLILFDQHKELMDDYMEFKIPHQIYEGRTMDPKTVSWWKRMNPEEFRRLVEGGCNTLDEFRKIIHADYPYDNTYVWSRGYMDFAILNHVLVRPYPYYAFRDVRTLDSIFTVAQAANKHNALLDCRNQIKYVQACMEFANGK